MVKNRFSTHSGAFALVGVDDGLGVLVEGGEALLDGLLVVVGAAGGLGAVEQPLRHARVRDVEVEDFGARQDLLLELLALRHLARVAVDEEALRAGHLGQHCLREQVEHDELKEREEHGFGDKSRGQIFSPRYPLSWPHLHEVNISHMKESLQI